MEDKIITECVSEFDTPLYLYSGEQILKNYIALKSALGSNVSIYYSVKANPLIGICQLLKKNISNIGIEAASKGEIFLALKSGYKPEHIIFTGPGKTREELFFAIEHKIKLINVESFNELLLVNRIAKEYATIVPIGLRINLSFSKFDAKMKMSGISSQFGIEEDEITDEFISKIKELQYVKICGIQVYMGTGILSASQIVENTKSVLELACRLEERFELKFEYLNMGGGFGVPYFEKEKELNMQELKKLMKQLFYKYQKKIQKTEIIFESGRFILANAGVFVTKVLDFKVSKGEKYIICDGGANFHASSAFLGRFVRNNFPMYVLGKTGNKKVRTTIAGPLCMPTDILGKDVMISQNVERGDFIVVEKSGAYGLTFSPFYFLSHLSPMEILSLENKRIILRRRGDVTDFFINQNTLKE